jgi:uncharacterized protein (DUF2141 family)
MNARVRISISTLLTMLVMLLQPVGANFAKLLFQLQVKLTVKVVGLRSNSGKVYVSVYNQGDGYPKDPNKAVAKTIVPIQQGQTIAVFDSLPAGQYAVGCYHDEDDNGKLNTNFLGIPTEGVGASNDATGFMGPPSFNDAKFSLQTDKMITIHIKY